MPWCPPSAWLARFSAWQQDELSRIYGELDSSAAWQFRQAVELRYAPTPEPEIEVPAEGSE